MRFQKETGRKYRIMKQNIQVGINLEKIHRNQIFYKNWEMGNFKKKSENINGLK